MKMFANKTPYIFERELKKKKESDRSFLAQSLFLMRNVPWN